MKQALSSSLTLLISAFLLLEGIWGLFSPVVYWVLTTNRAHAVIHIALGASGLVARRSGAIKGYFGFLGSLLVVVAVIWFVPAWREVPRSLFNINWQVAALNFIIGLVALAIAFTETSRRRNPTMKVPRKAA
jgi:hypothetical protein